MVDDDNNRNENQQEAKFYYQRGSRHVNCGQYEEAIDNFDRVLSTEGIDNEKISVTLYRRGYAYLKLGQYDEALDDYRMYLNCCNREWKHDGLFQIGIIYFEIDRFKQAIQYFSKAIEQIGDSQEEKRNLYYFYRGQAFDSDGKNDQAENDYRCVIKSQNKFLQGCAYDKLGDYVQAIQAFSDSLNRLDEETKVIPISAKLIFFRRGLIYRSLNKHKKALQDFQDAVKLIESDGSPRTEDRAYFYSALSNQDLGNIKEALINFKSSLSINPKQADVFYARGKLQYKLGRYEAAVRDHNQAFEIERERFLPKPSSPENNRRHYDFYEKKLSQLTNILQDKEKEDELKRLRAEYLQQQACYSTNPLVKIVLAAQILDDIIGLIIIHFFHARIFMQKFANKETDPETIINNCINPIQFSFDQMFELLTKWALNENYSELEEILGREAEKTHIKNPTEFDQCRNALISSLQFILGILQEFKDENENDAVQKEFRTRLCLKLIRIFFAVSITSTGIVGDSLETNRPLMMSVALKHIETIYDLVPLDTGPSTTIFSCCESSVSPVDQNSIQHTLEKIVALGSHKRYIKMSNEISRELADMYREQITRLQIQHGGDEASGKRKTMNNENNTSWISNCWKKFRSCLYPLKIENMNEIDYTPIDSIVTCATDLIAQRLTNIRVTDIENVDSLKEILVDAVCQPVWFCRIGKSAVRNIIELELEGPPKQTICCTVTDFFYRPAIKIGEETWCKKADEQEIYGYRKLSKREQTLKNDPDQLKNLGFIKVEDQKHS